MSFTGVDVLVLGSGFGGSLLSAALAKRGLQVAMVDKATHPRFAIGESSTPLADRTLAELATTYDLPELLPLTQYGSWKRTCPDLGCGLKRGFSYFGHEPGAEFSAQHQLLVAASDSDNVSDAHWLRSDVDNFLFRLARGTGVQAIEGAEYVLQKSESGWTVDGESPAGEFSFSAPFVVDATGSNGAVLRELKLESVAQDLRTQSSAVFAHFANVATVEDTLNDAGVNCEEHPFNCDAAAVHHVLKDGWMWQLRFDDDSVSVGMMVQGLDTLTDGVEKFWSNQIACYPFLKRQFAKATVLRPESGLQATGRIQRLACVAAGESWAALPSSVGFIDPLHSTGIAHTLLSVKRLSRILLGDIAARSEALSLYSDDVVSEFHHIDRLVEGCYAALPSFRLWSDWCMLYFAAATSDERCRGIVRESLLKATDIGLQATIIAARDRLQDAIDAGGTSKACHQFERWLRSAIEPWNQVGLLDPSVRGMYIKTAAPRPAAS